MLSSTSPTQLFIAVLTLVNLVSSHTVITYPGWRGDNLHSNGSYNVDDYKDDAFPYGMAWMYPCGGLRIANNRTYWPLTGGGIALQPGWFPGHKNAQMYFNLGIGSVPANYSNPMLPVFGIVGPQNTAYPGIGFCMPQVPLPANYTAHEGDNATIQIVEIAKHGAALYSCVDITFTANMSLVPELTLDNCKNDSQIGFQMIIATSSLTADAKALLAKPATWFLAATALFALGSTYLL